MRLVFLSHKELRTFATIRELFKTQQLQITITEFDQVYGRIMRPVTLRQAALHIIQQCLDNEPIEHQHSIFNSEKSVSEILSGSPFHLPLFTRNNAVEWRDQLVSRFNLRFRSNIADRTIETELMNEMKQLVRFLCLRHRYSSEPEQPSMLGDD